MRWFKNTFVAATVVEDPRGLKPAARGLSSALRVFATLCVASACASMACADNSPAEPAQSVAPLKIAHELPELEGLHERLVEIMEALRIPGLAVSVVHGDKIVYLDALGHRDVENKLPVTPDTTFYLASCTKVFTATAVQLLAEEGKIDLDAPVKKYLPRFELADPEYTKSVTVRDLLCHAKGIDSGPIVWLDAYTGEITEDRYYRLLREVQPTGAHQYTNVHFTLAGRVIESVTGRPWKDVLRDRIFKPVGMAHSTCYASEMYGDENAAIPAVRTENGFATAAVRKGDSTMHAAGGMGSSAADLARWLRLNLSGGRIDGERLLSETGVAEMHTLQAASAGGRRSNTQYIREGHGLGWFVGTYRGHRLLEHGGGYVGTGATISIMPEKDIGVAVVANVSGPHPQFIMREIYDRLLGEKHDDELPKLKRTIERRLLRQKRFAAMAPTNPARGDGLSLPPEAYAGWYENADLGAVHIVYVDGELRGTTGALSLRFGSTGKDKFYVFYGGSSPDGGRFEIAEDGEHVAAVIWNSSDFPKPTRFARR